MKSIREIENLAGKKVIVRFDFNVSIRNDEVFEDYKIKKALKTLDFLREKGSKIILTSHLEDKNKKPLSLRPVHSYLQKVTSGLYFASGFSELEEITNGLMDGQMVLLENLRFWDGEKANDDKFAERLASFAEIFINDGFSSSHRKHASIIGLPKLLPSYIGFQFEEEVKHLSNAFSPEHPFLFILGGTKIETKLPLLKKFSNIADSVFVGGVLANDIFKSKGWKVGKSAVSVGAQNYSGILENPKIILPDRVLVVGGDGGEFIKTPDSLKDDDSIKDIVVKNFRDLENITGKAEFILWNGPLGNLEEGFGGGTRELALLVTQSRAKTIVGGGDLLSVFDDSILEKFSFVSTGGGAMLDFLANGTLPGIEALELANSH